jgi:hypothetical protein
MPVASEPFERDYVKTRRSPGKAADRNNKLLILQMKVFG